MGSIRFLWIISAFVLLIFSCKKKISSAGSSNLSSEEYLNGFTVDTFDLLTYTVEEDSIITDNAANVVLGYYNDPEFGHLLTSFERELVDPIAELGPHVAPLGIAFYDEGNFPKKYKNSVFVALHGSWNRTKKSGYTLVFVKLDDDGNYLYQEDFISGWLSNESAWGRPVSPYIMNDGSMLLSDDKYNVIYRVTYKG